MHEMIARTVGPAIGVELRLESGSPLSFCDANQLENAILNLAINARDAMPGGGRLLIRTADVHCATPRQPSGLASSDCIRISVVDNGTGMDAQTAARAFEPFFTTKPQGEGTGLGLSMVFGFVNQSNGHVGLESGSGKGTAIHIDLPRHQGEAADDEAAAALPGAVAAPVRNATILLVDDETALRDIDQVDLLVSDVGLAGGMNGRQLADAVRATHPHTRVLFITGYAESNVLNADMLDQDMQMLLKPFALKEFRDRVGAMFAGGAEARA